LNKKNKIVDFNKVVIELNRKKEDFNQFKTQNQNNRKDIDRGITRNVVNNVVKRTI
jgi:hypothetical protein